MGWINRVSGPVAIAEQTYLMFMHFFLSFLKVEDLVVVVVGLFINN